MQLELHAQLVFVGRSYVSATAETASRGQKILRATASKIFVTKDNSRALLRQELPKS
jgi:hypothetical protein